MRLKYTFESVDMGEQKILVPVGDEATEIHGVLKLNKEGLEIAELLKEDISEERIVDILANKYENEREILAKYVHNAIEVMRKADLIED